MSIRVTVVDTENGDTETTEIENDYVLICAGTCNLAHSNIYPTKGTVVLTIKGRRTTAKTGGAS